LFSDIDVYLPCYQSALLTALPQSCGYSWRWTTSCR